MEKALLVIEGGSGRLTRDSLRELWHFREVLYAFVTRQVKVRYKQAAIGIGWSIVQPVLSAVLFAIFLGRFAHVSSDGTPYFLFALAGTAAWTYFSSAAGSAMDSLVSDQVLLRKVYFPREVLPVASALASLLDLLPALGVVAIAAAAYGIFPALSWLAVIVPVLLLVLTAAALGVGISAINVYYRDVRYALPFLLQLGLFASPVVYPLSVVPARWRELYGVLNPVAAGIDGIRRTMLHGQLPAGRMTLGAFAFATLLLLASYALFKRLERGFADRV
jgi:lipopolysaccharide transport system permease protein